MTKIASSGEVTANHDAILGEGPVIFWDTIAPDGDAVPWVYCTIGSIYVMRGSADYPRLFIKAENNSRDDDWLSPGMHVLSERVLFSEFTDGGAASGTRALTKTIPAGAWVLRSKLINVTGFTGNTSAVITIGDGTDVDRYNTGTPSVFTTAAALDMGAPSGTQIHTAAATVTLTVTGGSDFTAINAGAATVEILYWL